MHILEVFGRIFISFLFLVEAIRKFLDPDMSMMYMSDHGVPEFLFYPSIHPPGTAHANPLQLIRDETSLQNADINNRLFEA